MNTGAPLSFAQEQLWFVDQIRAGAAEYMSYRAFRLRGEIDAGVLRAALEEIARRHEVLRTRYESVDGTALQVVDDPGEVDFTVLHDAGINAGEIGRSVVCAPFDLRTRPPWRVVLARRAPADADLLIAVHHIAFDGWSWRLLVQELGILYEAFAQGLPSPLPELELQYADFADWQREAWEHAEHAEGLDWWRRRLAGLEPLELPTDRRRPAVWDASADVAEFSVPAGVAASVCAVAAAAEATPFMAYLAAFQVLLARYARRTDIAVGVSVSGREQFGLEDLIGLFVNTVVLRTDLSGAPTFAEMLARARDTALDAFDHQDVPFDRVVAALAPEPDLSRNPVFQAGFALLTEQVFGTLTLPGVEAEPMPARALGATFDLSLIMTQRADGTVAGRLCYPTALFDPATMDRLVEALQQLLAGLAAAPHQPVHAVDLLGDADRARLAEWNSTALPTTESSLPELFAAAALSAADAVAVVAGPAELTYAELADRVDRLAHHLRRLGVVAGTPVGVALPRGADLVTAVLAVLTAGAVYVPLPAEQPPSRLAAMVADAGVRLAVTDAQSRGLLPVRVEAVFAGGVSAEQPERAEARPAISAETAAYISFTSGSTGRPKGVVITHAGVRNRVLWAVDHLGLGPGERAHRDIDGGRVSFTVPSDVVEAVGAVGRQRRCTPFVTVLAAFEVLLARLTGHTDVAVGTPVAGRTQPAVENLLGFFVNHLVLRCDLSGDPAFTGVLDRVREVVLAGMANQDVPFERVVDALRPDRDLSRNPLFQIVFELDHAAAVPERLCGAAAEPVDAGATVAKFDLRLTTRLLDSGALRCTLEYAAALFDRSTIERMAAQFTRLLESIAAAPDAPVGALDLLTPQQRHTVLHEWADPAAGLLDHVDPPAVHRLGVAAMVEERVRRAPNATAVVYADQRLTYAQLNTRANRLAHHLRDLDVGPETVVGCLMERGADAIVVWLAVLKSGGVYLPIDPGNPAQRVGFLLTDTGAPIVLTTTGHAAQLPPGPHTVVTVDGSPAWADDPRTDNPAPAAEPGSLAYIIYTSGSTGEPKGVMIDHRAYAHHCRVISERYRPGPGDRVLLLSALTFDVAMDQIAVPLANGSALVVGDPWLWSPDDLLAKVREHGITTMQITPGYYREIMDRDVSALAGITLMNVGADVVTTADARRWTEAGLTGRFLYNYGPTEATVNCVVHTVEPDPAGGRAKAGLPIGVPLAGSPAYVLDAAMRPVPVGAPGELYVGGVRLARGYHDRPGLTAERFLPDPFGGTRGARLYRTGDLARHRADGTIEFLGRTDHQVKIRGYRIEPGEIEATLRRHAEVRAVAVVARQSPAGDRRLVAYVVAREGAGPTVADLRAHVGQSLPEYMVPAHWVLLDALPLTSSKKVDRTALPDPSWTNADGAARVAPGTPAQRAVASAWVQVLRIADPSVHDDFFDLGGHSLLAARLAGLLRDAFGVDIPLRLLFENTTIAEAATAITDLLRAQIAEFPAQKAGALTARGRRS